MHFAIRDILFFGCKFQMQQNVDQIEYSTLNNCKGLQDLKISVKYVPGWLGMFEGII